ncbi:MAG: sulfite dehydrogenase [Acidobacteria bacterium 13_1_20CM_2_65_9]|nr:MAG: sulfite dehydrogenase [Acidobacteria bacterium 13_1_20CM_2_65_9]
MTTRSRRWFLRLGAAWSAALVACRSKTAPPAAEPHALGAAVSPYGSRSRFERAARHVNTNTKVPLEEASSGTPLHDTYGIITPSSLHFERHHAGVPETDPATHTLTVHGLVDRPLVFTVDELKRLPSVSRIHFLECSGNSGGEWRGGSTESDVQRIHGLTSCSEWTGVPVSTLLRECGVQPQATWILAEGADACKLARSIPITKAMDDALVAYAQNGEPLRPEQGYPIRLFLPGWEGNSNVKWLRRIKVMDQPAMTREETSKYTDLMPDGTARQFTFDMEPKSVITRPSGGDTLAGAGRYEITGIAWSGRGTIARVEITVDGGATWVPAELQTPVLPRAHTRFQWPWTWDGREAMIASRCTDDTGYTQPPLADLIKVRGVNSQYHNNGIQVWKVAADGKITNGNRA